MLFSEVAQGEVFAFHFALPWRILLKKSQCPKAGAEVVPGQVWLLLELTDAKILGCTHIWTITFS